MDRSRPRRAAHRALRFESVEPRLLLSADWSGLDRARAVYGLTGRGQTVAVIDTGIAYRHTALGGGFGPGYRVVGGWDFAEQDADPGDDGPAGGHGTSVAGIIGSTDSAYPGIAPGTDLVALRVFDDDGQGSLGRVQEALEWVHANRNAFRYPITTVNVSLGVRSNSGLLPGWESLEEDLARLQADGIFVAVAAGNGFATYNQPGVNYPAASPYVVPVAAADSGGGLSDFSQRDLRSLVAPGRSVVSTVPDYDGNHNGLDDDFASYSGTSMAAAFVSGASVLLREACQLAGVQSVTEQSLYKIMFDTADTIHDPLTSGDYRRLNIDRAIASVMPHDDFGSSERAAADLGTLTNARTVSGMIEQRGDSDWFRFTAAQNGKLTLTAQTTGELQPQWQLPTAIEGATPAADGSLAFDVVAGQTYSFGLASQTGAGRYTIDARLAAAPSPDEPGTGLQQHIDSCRIDTAGQWFTLTASACGVLSVEALFSTARGDVDLQLFDATGRLIGISATTSDREQISVQAAAGATFRLRAYTYPGSGVNDKVDFLVTDATAPGSRGTTGRAAAVDLFFQSGGSW